MDQTGSACRGGGSNGSSGGSSNTGTAVAGRLEAKATEATAWSDSRDDAHERMLKETRELSDMLGLGAVPQADVPTSGVTIA